MGYLNIAPFIGCANAGDASTAIDALRSSAQPIGSISILPSSH